MAFTLLIDTTSTDEFYNGDCNYVVIELTKDFLEVLRKRVNLALHAFHQDPQFYEIAFWEYSHTFTGTVEFDMTSLDWYELLDNPNLPASEVEIPFLYVRCNGPRDKPPEVEIVFSGAPKDTSIVVTSNPVPLSVFFPEQPCLSTK